MKNIVITGIGRSGTGYLSKLLNSFENIIVLSEPPLFYTMAKPHRICELFDSYRFRILTGDKISHSSSNGEIIEDIRVQKCTKPEKIKYKYKDFVLAIKSPIPFLNRLPIFLEHFPEAKYVICIRNPIDTIASVRTFPNGPPPLEPINDWYYEKTERWKDIEKIKNSKSLSEISALTWKFHTDTVIENEDKCIITRYKDNIENPWKTINDVLKNINKGNKVDEIKEGKARKRFRNLLSDEDFEMIDKYCKENAQKLNIWGE